ncbi:MAG: hypothetical protein ACKVZ0_14330 [Gemmatimonadales bacterium]
MLLTLTLLMIVLLPALAAWKTRGPRRATIAFTMLLLIVMSLLLASRRPGTQADSESTILVALRILPILVVAIGVPLMSAAGFVSLARNRIASPWVLYPMAAAVAAAVWYVGIASFLNIYYW